MFGIVWKLLGLIPGLGALGAGFSLTGAIGAIAGAVATVCAALFAFLGEVGKSPLLAFLLGGAMFGTWGLIEGWTWDKPLRERAQRAAIFHANTRADAAIAKIRADYEDRLAAMKAAAAKKPKK
jgi:hypothetical protein